MQVGVSMITANSDWSAAALIPAMTEERPGAQLRDLQVQIPRCATDRPPAMTVALSGAGIGVRAGRRRSPS